MHSDIKESDWKQFKQLREIALERFFQRAVAGLVRKLGNDRVSNRDRFWDVHEQVLQDQKEIAQIFDGERRSMALLHVAMMRREGLVKDEELGRFSEEWQAQVRAIADYSK